MFLAPPTRARILSERFSSDSFWNRTYRTGKVFSSGMTDREQPPKAEKESVLELKERERETGSIEIRSPNGRLGSTAWLFSSERSGATFCRCR